MIPIGSIGPGPSRDPKDPANETESVWRAFGFELSFVAIIVMILVIIFLCVEVAHADREDEKLQMNHKLQRVEKND